MTSFAYFLNSLPDILFERRKVRSGLIASGQYGSFIQDWSWVRVGCHEDVLTTPEIKPPSPQRGIWYCNQPNETNKDGAQNSQDDKETA